MNIKKKYIKLFEKLNIENWDKIHYVVLRSVLNLGGNKYETLLYDIYYHLIHWLTECKGSLTIPSDNAWVHDSLKLDNLTHVGGRLTLHRSDVISLKNLEYVGDDLDLRGNEGLTKLPSLKYVGGDVINMGSGITKEYLLNKPDLVIKGKIYQ